MGSSKVRRAVFWTTAAASIATLTLGAGVTGVGASPNRSAAGLRPAGHARASVFPRGYTVTVSTPATVDAGSQGVHAAVCPTGTLPVGGGVYSDSPDLDVNIGTSYPSTHSWLGALNNASGTAVMMQVYAVCIKQPKATFSVWGSTFNAAAGSQSVGSVTCPEGSFLMGGGVYAQSSDTGVNIASTRPVTTSEWEAWVNNSTGSDADFIVAAVCTTKKPSHYALRIGKKTRNPKGTDTEAFVLCKGTSVPLSGGVYSSGSDLRENVNTTAPAATESGQHAWDNYFNNGGNEKNTIQAFAICAGA